MATEQTARLPRVAALGRACDPAGLGAFRVLFGTVLIVSVVRFVLRGWVDELYLAPAFHFSYDGFEWVRVLPAWGMYSLFGVMAICAVGVTLGVATRSCAFLFTLAFTYVELIDKTTYLNHYYFVSLMGLLLVAVPSDGFAAVSGRSKPVPAIAYGILRLQVAVVYVFAGIAKLDADWLLRAEPLRTWLLVFADAPLVGGVLAAPATAYAMSWAGAAFDLGIVPCLLARRTRAYAYVAAIAFHAVVGLLFPIGMFPWIMLAAAALFFDPAWPRRFLPTRRQRRGPELLPLSWPTVVLTAMYGAVQLVVPLRFLAYPGWVNWTEQGFRFAWRVMLMEKTGHVEYEVSTPEGRFRVDPSKELTPFQYRMLSTQPDMIHDYALALAERYQRAGHSPVHVYASAYAAINGRAAERLVDPNVDLSRAERSWAPKSWISPWPGAFRDPEAGPASDAR